MTSAPLAGKTVVVGVTGGIAAYKACEVVSRLSRLGARVFVIMTRAATKLVAPLTFQTLSGNPVLVELLEPPKVWNVEHIALAESADLMLVVPATYNIVGKMASGIADDFLSTVLAAVTAPVLLCPAMNHNMYANPIYQSNELKLRRIGYHVLEPETGRLASGAVGRGRLPDPARIVDAALALLQRATVQAAAPESAVGHLDYAGVPVLVTAGPTREFLDPVRFISNPASGRMGFAVAAAAARRGAQVTLVTGPVDLPSPAGVTLQAVVSADEMLEVVEREFSGRGLLVAAAAVSDYRPRQYHPQKVKKGPDCVQVELERTPDILATVAARRGEAVLVGFAAETANLVEHAREKLVAKHLDLVVANDITVPGAGFRTDTNRAALVWPDGTVEERGLEAKDQLAEHILSCVLPLVKQRMAAVPEAPAPGY